MFRELLLEIGTEEIPSDYLENGLKELRDLAESHLKNSRIEIGEPLVAYGTPRRLVLIGKAVQDKQDDTVQEKHNGLDSRLRGNDKASAGCGE